MGWGTDVRLLSFVIPDLIRDPQQRRSHGPRIKSGVTMINRAAISRQPTSCPSLHPTPPSPPARAAPPGVPVRSEEHTSELQSLMRISYAVFCLKTKTQNKPN